MIFMMQFLGVLLVIFVVFYLHQIITLFYAVKKTHPESIPNLNGLPTDLSNVRFLVLILNPSKTPKSIMNMYSRKIYTVRVLFAVNMVGFITAVALSVPR